MSHENNTQRRRKALAVLAGGLVLGIGAAVTLAAWNDSEFATGTFAAGSFDLEGSADKVVYADHAASPGATLDFTVAADNLTPGDVTYASFWVRLAAGTTSDGTLTADGVTADAPASSNSDALSYTVHAIGADAACDSTAESGILLASGATLGAFTAGSTASLTAGVELVPGTGIPAGAPVQLCLAVTAGTASGGFTQGQSTSATWSFEAVSS